MTPTSSSCVSQIHTYCTSHLTSYISTSHTSHLTAYILLLTSLHLTSYSQLFTRVTPTSPKSPPLHPSQTQGPKWESTTSLYLLHNFPLFHLPGLAWTFFAPGWFLAMSHYRSTPLFNQSMSNWHCQSIIESINQSLLELSQTNAICHPCDLQPP